MSDVVVDCTEKRLVELGAADAEVLVLAPDIAAFLDARPGLNKVVVTLQPPYEITVESQFSAAGYSLPPPAPRCAADWSPATALS